MQQIHSVSLFKCDHIGTEHTVATGIRTFDLAPEADAFTTMLSLIGVGEGESVC